MKNHGTTHLQLFSAFFRVGAVTFGGGYAMLPFMERELAEKRKWVSEEELLNYYAIGQSTPGVIAVNAATFVGFKKKGITGALAATMGMISPSLIIIMIIASVLNHFYDYPMVQKALKGINIAVAVLLTGATWRFAKKTIKNRTKAFTGAMAFLLAAFFRVSPITIVIASALTGLLAWGISIKKKDRAGEPPL